MNIVTYLLAILALACDVRSARILGLFPHTGKSHHMVFEPFLYKLAERGHHITVASHFPQQNRPANYTDVSLQGISLIGLETVDLDLFERRPNKILQFLGIERIVELLNAFWPLDEMALEICSRLVDLPALRDALKNKEYDLVIMENFNSDCMYGLLHIYGVKAPIVGLSSTGIMPWSYGQYGLNDNPSYVPLVSSRMLGKMSFWERFENTGFRYYYKYWYRKTIQEKEQEIIEKHFGKKIPDLKDLAKNSSLLIINTHHSLFGPLPTIPGLVEAGGMHLDHSRKHIPEYMERFINESTEGVVLVSFGSLIRTSTIPKYKEDMIINALSKLKQRVIWKYENSSEEGTLVENILKVKWIPQFELLRHPKILAFVAHGGLLGMTEAISAGKPLVVVPFFGDQPHNAAAAKAAGIADIVFYVDLTEEKLYQAVQNVLSAQTRLNARRLSQMWKDRPADPLDTAVYWTERVIRWGNSESLIPASRELSFIEICLLDVIATYLLIVLVFLVMLKYTFSLVSWMLSSGHKKQKVH